MQTFVSRNGLIKETFANNEEDALINSPMQGVEIGWSIKWSPRSVTACLLPQLPSDYHEPNLFSLKRVKYTIWFRWELVFANHSSIVWRIVFDTRTSI